MTAEAVGYLVDTNVLVYAYDAAEAAKRARAVSVLQNLGASGAGALSTQVLSEFFVAATRKIAAPLTAAQVERSLTNYARSWPVFDVTPWIVLEAVRGVQRYQLSFWDALIWATAKLNAVPNVLSEDFNSGAQIEAVRFLNPLDAAFDPALL